MGLTRISARLAFFPFNELIFEMGIFRAVVGRRQTAFKIKICLARKGVLDLL